MIPEYNFLKRNNPSFLDNHVLGVYLEKLLFHPKAENQCGNYLGKCIHWWKCPTERIAEVQAYLARRQFFLFRWQDP